MGNRAEYDQIDPKRTDTVQNADIQTIALTGRALAGAPR